MMATGCMQGKTALYRVQRRGEALIRSVLSREGRDRRNEKPRGCGAQLLVKTKYSGLGMCIGSWKP